MTNIFVANLDFGITSDDLRATFSQFGEVTYSHVVYDNKTKKSKGFGYVEMENVEEAIAAIQALHGVEVEGRALDVKIATDKDKREKKKEKEEPKQQTFIRKTDFRVKDAPVEKGKRVLRPRRKRKED